MRFWLLGTTALAAAAALMSPALAAEKIKLGVAGYYDAVGGWIDKSTDTSHHNFEIGSDSEIHVKGKTTLDNGIDVGFTAEIELEDDCAADGAAIPCESDTIDEIYADFAGFFGKIQFGQQDGVGEQMKIPTPIPFARVSSDDTEIDPVALANIDTELDDSGDNNKIIYFTPRLFGVMAGISYMPDRSKGGPPPQVISDPGRLDSDGDQALEAAVNWEYAIDAVTLGAALTYYTDSRATAGFDDPRGLNASASLGWRGFAVGGNFTDGENMTHSTAYSDGTDSTIWSAGLTWGNGPWLLGLNYANGEDEGAAAGDFSSINGGVAYELGPGITLGLGYQHDEADPSGGTDADGDAVFVETGLKF